MVRTKELYQQEREREVAQRDPEPTLAELDFDRRRYCRTCDINWQSLPTAEGEGEEEYDYCPVCKSDAGLEDGREGTAFSFSPIDGSVSSPFTPPALPEPPAVQPDPAPFSLKEHFRRQSEIDSRDDRALAAYLRVYETKGPEAAEKAFKEVLKKG